MTPKYIDIHAHVNFKAFKEDADAVIERALDNDTWVINVGSQFSTSKRAVEIANKYKEGVFAIVGLHPIHLEESYHDEEEGGKGFMTRAEEFDKEAYRELLKDPKVVGIGECGLDYFHCKLETVEKQKSTFREQISLAKETAKPLMLHIRNNPKDSNLNAYGDVLGLNAPPLKTWAPLIFIAWHTSSICSGDSTAQGPAMITIFLPPTVTPNPSLISVVSFLASIEASL